MARSDLPFGSEFSPAQIDLANLLELAHEHGPDWKAFENAVRERYFAAHRTSDYNKSKLANNTKLSLRSYGLIGQDDTTLSEVGVALHAVRGDERLLYERFARHVLMHCQGMNFVQCILDMHAAAEKINLNKLRSWLQERGIAVPRGAKHMSTLRLWLEQAGVVVSGYRIDQARLNEILNLSVEDFEQLAQFTPEQRAYLKALANMDGGGPHASNGIEALAAAVYGVAFNEKNLPKQVLYPLRDAGYIDLERGTAESGRGAKPFLVRATRKLPSLLRGERAQAASGPLPGGAAGVLHPHADRPRRLRDRSVRRQLRYRRGLRTPRTPVGLHRTPARLLPGGMRPLRPRSPGISKTRGASGRPGQLLPPASARNPVERRTR